MCRVCENVDFVDEGLNEVDCCGQKWFCFEGDDVTDELCELHTMDRGLMQLLFCIGC